ncbi:hypothetical protein A2U01_0067826, partial [Trifolium medium]|nr:hypothetical protein [Trifolium medium]
MSMAPDTVVDKNVPDTPEKEKTPEVVMTVKKDTSVDPDVVIVDDIVSKRRSVEKTPGPSVARRTRSRT